MLELAIIGCGIMGSNHARVAATSTSVDLTWVCDPDLERATALGGRFGAQATTVIGDAADSIDAAVLATPTATHPDLAIELIERGIHLLVEKPLAFDAPSARRIVDAAASAGVTLAVGHVERFNPAVIQLGDVLEDVVHVSAERISPFSARVADSVVLDLMIHDLDLVMSLVGAEVVDVGAVGRSTMSPTEDLVVATLLFENGVTADLTASRIGQNKIRRLDITQRTSFTTVDLLRQDIQLNRVAHAEYVGDEGTRYRQQGVVEIPFIETRGEPLALELEDFTAAIREGRAPRVDGAAGVRAVELCERILAAVKSLDS